MRRSPPLVRPRTRRGADEKFEPTAEAKKAYRDLARSIHPDLALDAAEKEKRHGLMAELNRAYSSGDQLTLNKLVEEMKNSPDVVVGDSVGDHLVRVIRQIFQVRSRFRELEAERAGGRDARRYMTCAKGPRQRLSRDATCWPKWEQAPPFTLRNPSVG